MWTGGDFPGQHDPRPARRAKYLPRYHSQKPPSDNDISTPSYPSTVPCIKGPEHLFFSLLLEEYYYRLQVTYTRPSTCPTATFFVQSYIPFFFSFSSNSLPFTLQKPLRHGTVSHIQYSTSINNNSSTLPTPLPHHHPIPIPPHPHPKI